MHISRRLSVNGQIHVRVAYLFLLPYSPDVKCLDANLHEMGWET